MSGHFKCGKVTLDAVRRPTGRSLTCGPTSMCLGGVELGRDHGHTQSKRRGALS